ncbi:MAG: hypothetical protein EOP77_00770 [Variovorax sp.]|nr:MAG: hypothetical protein EOP77_00770 [Variovorax sp.]
MIEMTADADPTKRWQSCWLEVTELEAVTVAPRWQACLPQFRMMCDAIMSDIQSRAGAACVMDWLQKVESGQLDLADVDGNAWIINITREKVWFEGLYSQGVRGEVSNTQFKLAVQSYLLFLDDPEYKTVKVRFPDC